MKWIKHMTRTRRDERIARLLGDGGMEGMARYGLYWAVQEIIAEPMEGKEPSCSVCYPVSIWSHMLLIRGSVVFSTLSTLAATGLLTVEREGSDIRVTNSKLLKYRDEYARKSGHTPDKVAPDTELELNTDTEKKQKPSRAKKPRGVADVRHQGCKEALRAYWDSRNPTVEMPWDGSEGKALGMLLSASPDLTAEKTTELLRNRYRSEVNHSDRPSVWLRSLLSYASGPIDRFGKPINATTGAANVRTNANLEALRNSIAADEDQDGPDSGGDVAGSQAGLRNNLTLFRTLSSRAV